MVSIDVEAIRRREEAIGWLKLLRITMGGVWPRVVFGELASKVRPSNLGIAIYLLFAHSYLGSLEALEKSEHERLDAKLVVRFIVAHVMYADCDPALKSGCCRCGGKCGTLREDIDSLCRLGASAHTLRSFLVEKWNSDPQFYNLGTLP